MSKVGRYIKRTNLIATHESEPRDAFSREVEKRLARLRALARVCSFAGGVILLVLAFVGLGSSVVPRIMGLQPYAIISGSMEPAYPTGSLVYAQPVSGEDLQPGEVAAFWRDGDVIVHRVDSIDATEKEFVAKGDANDDVDLRPVPFHEVLGRVVFSVPYVGYFLMALGSLEGKLLLGWVVLMGTALCILGSVLGSLATRQGSENS